MIKKKAKGKASEVTAKKKTAKKRKPKKPANSAEVRSDIAKMVNSGARKMTKAVMDQAMTGQLAPTRYLFEVAGVYPPITDGSQSTTEEDCLAKTLLDRLNIPDKPVVLDEEDELTQKASSSAGEGVEKVSSKADGGQKVAHTDLEGDEGKEVSV